MKILGLKLTHDAGVTLIEDGKLIFSVEMEKVNNRSRYTKMLSLDWIKEILISFNQPTDFSEYDVVIDGWKYNNAGHGVDVCGYSEFDVNASSNILDGSSFYSDYFGKYTSYPHALSHITGAYCASKFSGMAYALTWDGGQNPRIHLVNPECNEINFMGVLSHFYGILYGIMGHYFGPYSDDLEDKGLGDPDCGKRFGAYDFPGKLMSYMSVGEHSDYLISKMNNIYSKLSPKEYNLEYKQDGRLEHAFCKEIKNIENIWKFSDADILINIQEFIKIQLLEKVESICTNKELPLIFSGGSALNIKWNSALRNLRGIDNYWVPPFPNDAGSSLGVACSHMIRKYNNWNLDWNVFSGPEILDDYHVINHEWDCVDVDEEYIAKLLANNPSEPIIALHGRAELGPRALGHRSILMSALIPGNKDKLNEIKRREHFRPVAPICLESRASKIFTPGCSDPYMLFDHQVIEKWKSIIPAIVHTDGSARLQTMSDDQCPKITKLLQEYEKITGIPVLCNTSANFNGSGFFPNVSSAAECDYVNYIWCNDKLYIRKLKNGN